MMEKMPILARDFIYLILYLHSQCGVRREVVVVSEGRGDNAALRAGSGRRLRRHHDPKVFYTHNFQILFLRLLDSGLVHATFDKLLSSFFTLFALFSNSLRSMFQIIFQETEPGAFETVGDGGGQDEAGAAGRPQGAHSRHEGRARRRPRRHHHEGFGGEG